MDTLTRFESPAQRTARQQARAAEQEAAARATGFPVLAHDIRDEAVGLVAHHYPGQYRVDIEAAMVECATETWFQLGGGQLIGWQFDVADVILFAEIVRNAYAPEGVLILRTEGRP